MGSFIEINDTLRITKEQGFPDQLDLDKHIDSPYSLEDIENEEFSFSDKPSIRIYKSPPVRNFLVEDIGGKWVYWGLCYITEITHNYVSQTTSGKYKIIQLNSPENMKKMFELTHYNKPEQNYFN